MNFYGLLHKNLLLQTFEGDITGTNIVLPEIGNHLLVHYAKPGGGTDGSRNDSGNSDSSATPEREIRSLQYIAGYVIHKLYERLKFTKKNKNLYSQQFISILFESLREKCPNTQLFLVRIFLYSD